MRVENPCPKYYKIDTPAFKQLHYSSKERGLRNFACSNVLYFRSSWVIYIVSSEQDYSSIGCFEVIVCWRGNDVSEERLYQTTQHHTLKYRNIDSDSQEEPNLIFSSASLEMLPKSSCRQTVLS